MDTMTQRYLGQVPGRARRGVSAVRVRATIASAPTMSRSMSADASWRERSMAPAFHGCGTTGVAAFPTNAHQGNTANPADAKGLTTIKRTARHLRTRST